MDGRLSPPFDQQVTLSLKILSPSFGWGLSPPFDQQVTLSPRNQYSNLGWGLSLPFDQQVTLRPKILSPIFGWGVISAFWSASDTESQNPKSQLWMGVVSTFWSASDTESQKLKFQLWMGLSLPFDQQVTLSPEILSPYFRYGGVSTLAQNTSSFQEVSRPRQRHLVLMRCYLLTIQFGNERIAVRSLLLIHNSKK